MFPQAARIAARSPQGANSPAAGNAIAPADKQLYGYCVRRRRGGGRGWGWEQRLSVSRQKTGLKRRKNSPGLGLARGALGISRQYQS